MSETTHAGPSPRTNGVAPNDDKTDARCLCGAPAVGLDARDGEATCADCARLQADGGQDEIVRRCLIRAAELRREARQLEIAALGMTREEGA